MPERVNDEPGPEETDPGPNDTADPKDEVEEQSEESFPASDPPSY